MAAPPRTRRDPRVDRALLWCGAVAGPLFVLVFLLEGATRVGYEPLRHPVSSLALGPDGWMQVVNFVVAGALHVAGAAGLWRTTGARLGPLLVAAAGVGLIGAGVFVTDPVNGYPPGTPSAAGPYSPTGALHDLFSVPTFLGIPLAGLAFGRWFLARREPAWAVGSIAAGLAMVAAFVMASAGFGQAPAFVGIAGLLQRISIAIGFGWLTALALRALSQRLARDRRRATRARS